MRLIKNLTIALGVLALFIAAPACDSGDGGEGGTTGTGGTGTGTGESDAEHNHEEGDTHEEHHADGEEHHEGDSAGPTTGEGPCMNEADQAIIADNDIPGMTQTAAFACLADEDPGACTAASVSGDTGMSEACVACYAEQVTCALEFCAADCIADAEGEACTTCREENCIPLFEPCSGIPSSTDE